ncbi:MAG: hypothetical protein ACRDQ0_04495, partial [Pseudonocardia sp.]
GEPIRPDLPDPDPTPQTAEENTTEINRSLRRHEARILQPPVTETPRPPPPDPDPHPDEGPPPF